eukprot:scaffold66944_cov73-Phaeocystis_antarctica.AAC.1
MIGCIKAISPCVKSASAKLFLDLHTVLAPSGEERTLDAAAQVERAGRCCRRFDGRTHACCGRAAVMVLVSSASGPRVSGCTVSIQKAMRVDSHSHTLGCRCRDTPRRDHTQYRSLFLRHKAVCATFCVSKA